MPLNLLKIFTNLVLSFLLKFEKVTKQGVLNSYKKTCGKKKNHEKLEQNIYMN